MSRGVDDQPENARSLLLGPTRLFRIVGVGRRDRLRRRDAATNLEDAATDAATAPSPDSGAVTYADATARAGTDATARTGAVRRRRGGHDCGSRRPKIRHVILRNVNLWRDHNGRLNREARFFVSHDDCWRRDLLHRELRQTSLRCRQRIAITTAAATADHRFGSPQGV